VSTPAACVNGPLANTGSQDCLGIGQLVWLHVVAASDALVEAWVKGGAEHAVACLASSHQSKRTTAGTCIILTSSSKEASLGKAPHTPDSEAQQPGNHRAAYSASIPGFCSGSQPAEAASNIEWAHAPLFLPAETWVSGSFV
jgi:hypothetical protein